MYYTLNKAKVYIDLGYSYFQHAFGLALALLLLLASLVLTCFINSIGVAIVLFAILAMAWSFLVLPELPVLRLAAGRAVPVLLEGTSNTSVAVDIGKQSWYLYSCCFTQ